MVGWGVLLPFLILLLTSHLQKSTRSLFARLSPFRPADQSLRNPHDKFPATRLSRASRLLLRPPLPSSHDLPT